MQLIVNIGQKLRFVQTNNLKSSFIWPLYDCGQEKQFCLHYLNLTKELRCDIFWLEQIAIGPDLKLLYDYKIISSDIIVTLSNLRRKKKIVNKDIDIISCVNRFKTLKVLTERIINRLIRSSSPNEKIDKLILKLKKKRPFWLVQVTRATLISLHGPKYHSFIKKIYFIYFFQIDDDSTMSEKKILISVEEYKRLKTIEEHCHNEHQNTKPNYAGKQQLCFTFLVLKSSQH